MLKLIKKIVLSSLSVLIFSFLVWLVVFLNPGIVYAHATTYDIVTVYHNQPLEAETEEVVLHAIEIIKTSELFDETVRIDLCLNEDAIYPHWFPLKGGIAYATLNKCIIYASTPDFSKNITEYQWEVNENELRIANLTWVLAHEFTHNLQFHMNWAFQLDYNFGSRKGTLNTLHTNGQTMVY